MASWKVSLYANGAPIAINDFTQDFIGNVVAGMLSALKDTETMGSIRLLVNGDAVSISRNDVPVRLNPFVSKFINRTVTSMLASIKGVSQTDSLAIRVAQQDPA
jgi:hypothetical protein